MEGRRSRTRGSTGEGRPLSREGEPSLPNPSPRSPSGGPHQGPGADDGDPARDPVRGPEERFQPLVRNEPAHEEKEPPPHFLADPLRGRPVRIGNLEPRIGDRVWNDGGSIGETAERLRTRNMMRGCGDERVGAAEEELFDRPEQGVQGALPPLLEEDVRVMPEDDLFRLSPEEERKNQGDDGHRVRVMEQDRLEAPLFPETVQNPWKRGKDRREKDRSAFLQIMDCCAPGLLNACGACLRGDEAVIFKPPRRRLGEALQDHFHPPGFGRVIFPEVKYPDRSAHYVDQRAGAPWPCSSCSRRPRRYGSSTSSNPLRRLWIARGRSPSIRYMLAIVW